MEVPFVSLPLATSIQPIFRCVDRRTRISGAMLFRIQPTCAREEIVNRRPSALLASHMHLLTNLRPRR
jgi:hypothetical protein